MSRTDKDRPAWIQQYDLTTPASIHHDHTRGRCVEETFEYSRWRAGHGWSRNHRCWKVQLVEEPCPHDRKRDSLYRSPCYTLRRRFESWMFLNPMYEDRQLNPFVMEDHVHTRTVRHDDWSCYCDDWPETPTCEYFFDRRYIYYARRYYGVSVPRWYRAHIWYEPERTRERDVLRETAKAYNAGDDLEDWDFPNFQHRHGAGWYWD